MPVYSEGTRWRRLANDIGWTGELLDLRGFVLAVLLCMSYREQNIREAMIRFYFRQESMRPNDPTDARFLQLLLIGRGYLRMALYMEYIRDGNKFHELMVRNEQEMIEEILGEGEPAYAEG